MKKREIALIVIPIILFAILAVFIFSGISTGFEDKVYNETTEHMSDVVTNIVKGITFLGNPVIVIFLCLSLMFFKKTRFKFGIPVSVVVIVSYIVNILLKNIFTRQRPDILRLITETSYSFPSGHAMINASLYTIIIILAFEYIENVKIKYGVSIVSMILIITIGFSRVYLGVHYATDIIGGWLLGFTVSVITYLIIKNKNKKIKNTN